MTLSPQNFAKEISLQSLSNKLESSLNNEEINALNKFMSTEIYVNLKNKYNSIQDKFSNAKWEIKPGLKLKDNRQSINVYLTAEKQLGDKKYSLKAAQRIAISKENSKIINQEVLSEYSILKDLDLKMDISINIPDSVLTGSKYDIDIILEEPLEDAIIAGGLAAINSNEKENIIINKNIPLAPMGSGGLFKTVQAPLTPGKQEWAALIAHPKGLISITKMVRIVSN